MSTTEQRTDQTAVVTHASIAEPIRIGVYQDGDDYELLLPARHVLVMGMTGSGKSISSWWNDLGDVMTPRDAAATDNTGEGGWA